jgi:hypothetical protein
MDTQLSEYLEAGLQPMSEDEEDFAIIPEEVEEEMAEIAEFQKPEYPEIDDTIDQIILKAAVVESSQKLKDISKLTSHQLISAPLDKLMDILSTKEAKVQEGKRLRVAKDNEEIRLARIAAQAATMAQMVSVRKARVARQSDEANYRANEVTLPIEPIYDPNIESSIINLQGSEADRVARVSMMGTDWANRMPPRY